MWWPSVINCLNPGHDYISKGNGTVFPGEIVSPSGKSHKLLAIGIRQMSIFKFQLYMIGLYVEDKALKALEGLSPKTSENASKLLIDGDYEWSLRIAPLRNGSLSHLRDALVRRLKQVNDPQGEEITSFSGILPNIPMSLNSVFLMSYWRGKGVYITKDEQPLGTTQSAFVRKGLLSIYTDPANTTIPELIDDIQDSLKKLQ